MPILRLFQEFAVDYGRVKLKYFDVQKRWRFLARLIQGAIPFGIWFVLYKAARDVKRSHPETTNYFNALYTFSFLCGPIAAALLTCLQTVPLLADPLTSAQTLMVEAVADAAVAIVWLAMAIATPATLANLRTVCERVVDVIVVPTMNATLATSSTTPSPGSPDAPAVNSTTAAHLNSTTTTSAYPSAIPTDNSTAEASPTTTTVPYDCHGQLAAVLTGLTAALCVLYLASLAMDYHSFMKGAVWDIEAHEEREHAASMATVRQLTKHANRIGRGEIGGVSMRAVSRRGSLSAFGSINCASGAEAAVQAAGGRTRSGSVRGGCAGLQGVVAGKAGGVVVLAGDGAGGPGGGGGGLKRSASNSSLSGMAGPPIAKGVDGMSREAKSRLGLSAGSISRMGSLSRLGSSSNLLAGAGGGSSGNVLGSTEKIGSRVRSGSAASLLAKGGSMVKKR